MRFFLSASLCLSLVSAANAADEATRPEPPSDKDFTVIVAANDGVLFKVPSGKGVISCTGKFSNTEGNFDGPFATSVRVKFGAAAEGKANRCEFTLTTAQGPGKPPVARTAVLHVIVPKIVNRTLAHVPGSSDDRTTIGVGEEVMYKVEPKEWLLDSDITWHNGQPSDTISNHSGLATIYQAGMPVRVVGKHRKIAASQGSSTVTMFIPNGTDEVSVVFSGDAPTGSHDRSSGRRHGQRKFTSGREHTPTVLAAAYKAKLDGIDARLDAHQWSPEPVMVRFDASERTYQHFFVDAKGFGPALLAIATMQSRLPGGGDQPEDLQAREIRLVARIVATFHRAVAPGFDPANHPSDFVNPPAGYTLIPKVIVGSIQPEDIREPDLRRQFKKAIVANDVKRTEYNKQVRADEDDQTLRRFAWSYLQELCGRSDPRLKRFQRELIALGVDERTAREFSKRPRD